MFSQVGCDYVFQHFAQNICQRYWAIICSSVFNHLFMGAGIAQAVETLYIITELHTSFRTGSSPARDKIFIWKIIGRNVECMWFGCRLPVAVVSHAYPGNAEICSWLSSTSGSPAHDTQQ